MSGLGFDPPAWPALVAGGAALVSWLALARPRAAAPARAALRVAAALLLAGALLDVGCRGAAGGERPRLRVLLDASRSMDVPGPDGISRSEAARAFLESDAFRTWSEGWEVVVDSFGGATTDPGAALRAAAAGTPDAILLVSDGRATAGLATPPAGVDVWTRAPDPIALEDAAVLDVAIDRAEDGPDRAVVDVAAAGGVDVPAGLDLVVSVDGREAGRIDLGPLASGERRTVRVALPERDPGTVVEARLDPARDAVAANDRRSVVDAGGEEARRALVVGLAPGWEMGPWRRAVADARPGPVEALWAGPDGRLRPVDGGPPRAWDAIDPARVRSVHLVGDPARLGSGGRAWLERFAAAGGRGIVWIPGGAGGSVVGVEVGPGGRAGPPVTTPEGRAWLAARGVGLEGPDGGPAWPALERLPRPAPELPPRATVLFEADGAPAAWVEEREDARIAVLAGTGWYRWPIETGGPAGPAPAFWEAWTDALVRWVSAAPASDRPLVRWPGGARLAAGRPIEARVASDVEAAVEWAVEDAAGSRVAGGEVPAPAGGKAIGVGPLDPGVYRLTATADGGRAGGGRFVVESWVPDLARTEADTAALAAARSGAGGRIDGVPSGRLEPPASAAAPTARAAGPGPGLGTRPWAYLLAALLLLGDWALGARALARPEGAR